jgi:hypothetical protein
MSAAGTNKPEGSRYNKLFGTWLKNHGFDDIDESDRKRLFDVLEHRSEIEQWRKSLPQTFQPFPADAVFRCSQCRNGVFDDLNRLLGIPRVSFGFKLSDPRSFSN